jgi:large subunit ribosomal protein L24
LRRSGAREGGIVETEGYVDVSNVMLVHPGDNKPSRIRVEERDGLRVRVFVRGGEPVPDPTRA